MSSVSGLSDAHRAEARRIVARGCELLLAHARDVHYTMGPRRWSAIDARALISRGQILHEGDCSSTATWLLWNALAHHFGVRDVVNDTHWRAGYTGTIARHGKPVQRDGNIKLGDLILYGRPPVFEHVAVAASTTDPTAAPPAGSFSRRGRAG
jgi:hypothetical protein